MFHPATRPMVGPRALSAHELVNQAVAPLHVICTGQENGRLYFEKMPGAKADNHALVQEILSALNRAPKSVRDGLAEITTISLKP